MGNTRGQHHTIYIYFLKGIMVCPPLLYMPPKQPLCCKAEVRPLILSALIYYNTLILRTIEYNVCTPRNAWQVVFNCLEALAAAPGNRGLGIVENAVMLGTPVGTKRGR